MNRQATTAGRSPVAELLPVHILGMPVDVYLRSQQHNDELLREFALLLLGAGQGSGSLHPAPRRLLALIDELTRHYEPMTAEASAERDARIASGQTSIDLTYYLPLPAAGAARTLRDLMEEADEFCGEGQHLLTLKTPPDLVRFRRWFLEEIIDQLETGRPPRRWSDYPED